MVSYILEQRPLAKILVLDDLSRGSVHNLKAVIDRVTFVQTDLRSQEKSVEYIRNADTVIHLADVVAGIDYIFSHQAEVFRTNVLINTNVLYATRTNHIKNYLYVGTACSYPLHLQNSYQTVALVETQTYPAEPESSYGWSKLMGEYEAMLVQAEDPTMNIGINRLHNVYGPGMIYGNVGSQIIPSLIRKALLCPHVENFTVWGSGNQYRDFIHVSDVVKGIWATLQNGGMNKGTIQLSTGVPSSIKDTAEIILAISERVLGKPACNMVVQDHMREGDKGRVGVTDKAKQLINWSPQEDFVEGIANTFVDVMNRMKDNNELPPEALAAVSRWKQSTSSLAKSVASRGRTLVIVAGQARGGELAWKSLKHNLLAPLNADLALFMGDSQPIPSMLADMAKYQWTLPEVSDWGVFFDMAAAQSCPQSEVGREWRAWLCQIPGIMLGGVNNCGNNAGSGGILLSFRLAVHNKLSELKLWDKYEYFMFTRSDYVYLCPHQNPKTFEARDVNNAIFIPEGEDYGGITDRHLVANSHNFFKAVNIGPDLVCKSQLYNSMLMSLNSPINLEVLLMVYFKEQQLEVQRYPRVMFSVKTTQDPTRWSHGEDSPLISNQWGLKLKYPQELVYSMNTCNATADKVLREFEVT
jgi:nucleoside-diphosphate-sugar epimerase